MPNAADPLDRAVLPDVLTVVDLSLHLGRSLRFCRALVRSGRLPGVKLGGRWYVDRGALRAVLREGACGAAAGAAGRSTELHLVGAESRR